MANLMNTIRNMGKEPECKAKEEITEEIKDVTPNPELVAAVAGAISNGEGVSKAHAQPQVETEIDEDGDDLESIKQALSEEVESEKKIITEEGLSISERYDDMVEMMKELLMSFEEHVDWSASYAKERHGDGTVREWDLDQMRYHSQELERMHDRMAAYVDHKKRQIEIEKKMEAERARLGLEAKEPVPAMADSTSSIYNEIQFLMQNEKDLNEKIGIKEEVEAKPAIVSFSNTKDPIMKSIMGVVLGEQSKEEKEQEQKQKKKENAQKKEDGAPVPKKKEEPKKSSAASIETDGEGEDSKIVDPDRKPPIKVKDSKKKAPEKKKTKIKEPKGNEGEDVEVNPSIEEEMTAEQKAKKKEILKSLKEKKADFVKKYGDRAENVMHATATKLAMKEEKVKSMAGAKLKIGRDTNGNRVLQVKIPGSKGFSVQTNGNLVTTHRHGVNKNTETELRAWIAKFGTVRQKQLLAKV